jgi:hypothetical protein
MSVEFGGCKPMKTTKISVQGKSNLSVTFEEELWIPIWVPTMCKRFALTIMNRYILVKFHFYFLLLSSLSSALYVIFFLVMNVFF